MSIEVDIEKSFKGFHLHVKFTTSSGMLGILGASGCGKSMTLKCIAGIETPDKGEIKVNGRILYSSAQKINIKPQQRKVGYLFQNYALFPNMTVEKNIACGIPKEKKAEKEKIIQEMLEQFHIAGLEKRLPSELSGGQQQRVALARIFASEPEVLLLDEPFSALDEYLKESLQIELRKTLQNYAGDAIMVSHSRDEIYNLCQNVLVLDKGRDLLMGPTKEVFATPRYEKVARLTGCKNFSRAKRIDEHILYAKDWGITFVVDKEIDEKLVSIGIRAHNFLPTEDVNAINYFPANILQELETPFEWNIMIQNSEASEPVESIWWKLTKENYSDNKPTGFYVLPENILVLTEKELS